MAKRSYEQFVHLMLGRTAQHDKTRFSDIDIKEMQNRVRTKKMLSDLQLRTAETTRIRVCDARTFSSAR